MKITIGSKFLFSTEKKYIIMPKVVRDIMTKYVVTIDENRTALEAAKIMAEKGISSLIVLKDQNPVGIVTERDFVKKICIKELKISQVKVNEIMSKIRTFADPEVPIEVAVQRMVNHRIRRLPIMENGKVVGIITVTDLAKYLRTMLLIEGALSEKSKS
jgi:CBS domain-containing protein